MILLKCVIVASLMQFCILTAIVGRHAEDVTDQRLSSSRTKRTIRMNSRVCDPDSECVPSFEYCDAIMGVPGMEIQKCGEIGQSRNLKNFCCPIDKVNQMWRDRKTGRPEVHEKPTINPLQEEVLNATINPLQEVKLNTSSDPLVGKELISTTKMFEEKYMSTTVQSLQEEALKTTIKPLQEEDLNTTIDPLQKEVLNTTIYLVQGEALTTTIKPLQEENLNTTIDPSQKEVLNTTIYLLQGESLTTTIKPLQEEDLNTTIDPSQKEVLNTTMYPLQGEATNLTVQPFYVKEEPECGITYKSMMYKLDDPNPFPNDWPWMAVLLLKETYMNFCGGVLINRKFVLSAAHCYKRIPMNDTLVRLGEYDFSTVNETQFVDYGISEIIFHSDYIIRTQKNDIALLKLDKIVEYTAFIRPICLPKEDVEVYGRIAMVIGWGQTYYGSSLSNVLREVAVPIWNHTECKNAYFQPIYETNICAASYEGGRDSCLGDSGGPLMVQRDDGRWTNIGIVSWGVNCGKPGLPGVYTLVTKYLKWIAENSKV